MHGCAHVNSCGRACTCTRCCCTLLPCPLVGVGRQVSLWRVRHSNPVPAHMHMFTTRRSHRLRGRAKDTKLRPTCKRHHTHGMCGEGGNANRVAKSNQTNAQPLPICWDKAHVGRAPCGTGVLGAPTEHSTRAHHVQESKSQHAGCEGNHDHVPRVGSQGQVQLTLQGGDEGGDGGIPRHGPGLWAPRRHQLLQASGKGGHPGGRHAGQAANIRVALCRGRHQANKHATKAVLGWVGQPRLTGGTGTRTL